ncbi:MAG: amidohydrolase [Phycisphaerales bacterium]|nr:amidohydrolase [Phycisphaerales bacterium]
MDPGWPSGTAVAVRDGKVLSVGRSMEDLAPWLDAARRDGTTVTVDDSFRGHVLVPGFVEAHGHPLIGAVALAMPSLSYYPQQNPYGPAIPGVKDIAAVEQAIRSHLASHPADGQATVFWGYDVAAMGRHLDREFLDRVAGDRPVWVWDASEHFVYGSTAAMKERGITRKDLEINGVMAGPDGEPNGQFLGATAASWLLGPEMERMLTPAQIPAIMKYLVDLGWRNGITTTSDMALGMLFGIDRELANSRAFFHGPHAPLRCVTVVAADIALRDKGAEAVGFVKGLAAQADDKLMFAGVKFFADDSFLSFGMQVTDPGYTDGRAGMWMTKPDEMAARYRPWWDAGLQLHTHTNGNAGVRAVIDALAALQESKPRFDHRFTIQHYGISTPEDAARLARLGGFASVNPYYVYQRAEINVPFLGTDRAETAARLRTLVSSGVLTALHTDTPVAPPHPLEAMWIAVNRLGVRSGKVLAPDECVTPYQAMRMVTVDAAATLGVEDKVGSIRAGKFADFTVLAANPLEVEPTAIRDIAVWGVVIGGTKYPASDIKPLAKAVPEAKPAPAAKPAAAETSAAAAPAGDRPRSLAERYGNPAARLDIDAAVRHADGCRLEFWRALAVRNADSDTRLQEEDGPR